MQPAEEVTAKVEEEMVVEAMGLVEEEMGAVVKVAGEMGMVEEETAGVVVVATAARTSCT